jgi:hypothetical protein
VERFRTVDSGKAMEVLIQVEDPGAFTTSWSAIQRFARNSKERQGMRVRWVRRAFAPKAAV